MGFDVISFYPVLLIIATCVTIFAGLLRTPEEKEAATGK